MAGNWVDFKEIKRTITMEMVLGHYGLMGEMKTSSKGLKGACPIHGGSHNNQFHVNTKTNRWNCFGGCDMDVLEGHVIGFVAAMENVGLREAALLIAEWFGLDTTHPASKKKQAKGSSGDSPAERLKEKKIKPKAKPEEKEGKPEPPKEASAPVVGKEAHQENQGEPENKKLTFQLKNLKTDHPFFEERHISPESIEHFGLGLCSKGLMKNRIVFPIHDREGDLIGYTGRTVNEISDDNPKWLIPPKLIKPKVLFNLHRIGEKAETVILVEGPLDLVAVHQAGFSNVVALLGKELLVDGDLAYDQLRLITENFTHAVLLFDGDTDGRKRAKVAVQKLISKMYVRDICLPDERDPGDLNSEELQTFLSFLS